MPERIDEELIEGVEEEGVVPYEYSITSYGADYPVDGLVKRVRVGDIYIPKFQRAYVWTYTQASRFVESLLLGLPVPAIFLSREPDTKKLLVIDGHQRLRTLQFFYDGVFAPNGKEFSLKGVPSRFQGETYRSLAEEDRRRLDDAIVHAIIVKQDEPSEYQSSIYHIFERLNTGGTALHPQEIRACIYHGEFNDLLSELNKEKAWRHLYGPPSPRMRDQELILRFFALLFATKPYEKPMTKFLNSYMAKNRHLRVQPGPELRDIFRKTVECIETQLGTRAFKPRGALNAAVFDALTVGIGRRLAEGEIKSPQGLVTAKNELFALPDLAGAVERATSDEESVNRRLELATGVFAKVK